MVVYWIEEFLEDISSLIDVLGKDKWWINLYLFGIILGIILRGDIWYFLKGGFKNGLVSLWVESFLFNLVFTVFGFFNVDDKINYLNELKWVVLYNLGENLEWIYF